MTGLFLARHANNFLSARKAGQGGWGQINNALKSLLQEIVVFFNGGLFMACIMSCCLTLDSPTLTYSSRPCSNLTLPHRGLSSFVLICRPDDIYKEESGRHKKQMRGVRGVIIRIKVCKAPAHQFRPKPLFAALQPIKRRLVEIIPDSRQNISTVFFQFVQF